MSRSGWGVTMLLRAWDPPHEQLMHGPDGTLLVFETEAQAQATARALGSLPDATFRAVPLDAWEGEMLGRDMEADERERAAQEQTKPLEQWRLDFEEAGWTDEEIEALALLLTWMRESDPLAPVVTIWQRQYPEVAAKLDAVEKKPSLLRNS